MMSLPFREWGTRFDSLSTSPSPSNSSSLSRNPQTTTRAATSTASSSLLNPQATAVTQAKFPPQSDAISNEPSVFVGSLPTTVDHTELSARLREHLSAYVEINFVRIIRDSRGGVCAFVQCNDPASAAQLIHTVRSLPPQSFMGRYLRLEPARSQRTLWISYRKPVEIIRDADRDQPTSSYSSKSRFVEFDLPKAMRVYRTLGSRRIEILYNAPALQFDDNAEATLSQLSQEQDDPAAALSGSGLLLSPLQFDAQTLHRIASSFGPVESFDHRQPEHVDDQERLTYPYPHNADRSAGMDPGCWEVKWENRNDCLTALAALRNVPHLTVTWPNQQHALIPRRSGLVTRGHQVRDQSMVKRKSGPQHIQGPFTDNDNMASQVGISMNLPASKTEATVDSRSSERLSCLGDADPPTTTDCWTVVESGSKTDFLDVPLIVPDVAMSERPSPTGGYSSNIPPQTKDATPEQGDVVFGASAALSQASNPLEWSEVVSNSLAHSKSEILASSPSPLDTPTHRKDPQSPAPAPSEPFVDLASPFAPRSPGNGHPRVGRGLNFYDSFTIPAAPQWSDVRPRRSAGLYNENVDINTHNALDTTTIFVGGLEVHGRCTWDEHRLRRIFGQYGEIVEVKLVRPAHRKSAFAFVTYRNNKSSSRAVLEEHNRIYDGRYIRVQLRDSAVQKTHGLKSHFRSSEGRPFSPRHQFSSKTEGPPAYDSPLHVQNGIRSAIPAPCEELATAFSRSPNSTASGHPDMQAQLSENTCVQGIPSHAPSTVSSAPVPPMTYPPPPHTAFYAPTPWYMPYPYAPTPHILPRYPQIPLASHVVTTNETGRHIPPHSIYQPMPHYPVYPLPLPPIPTTGQQHADLAGLTERRAPLQPTGFIESEQGLIPVYAPEALGEYMANTTSSRQNPPEAGGTHSAPHPPMMVPETRLSQPTAMYAVYPPPQYHPSFARDRGTMMMAGLSQQHPSNTNLGPVGNGYTWYPDTVHPDIRTQTQANLRVAAPLTTPQLLGTHHAIPPSGQPPRAQSTYSERGFGLSKRRGLGDRSTLARISRGNNVSGTHATRRRGHFKHIGGAVSMSAVMDQTGETCLDDVAVAVDPIVRASTSSPAVFDLTPISPAHGPQL
ncbi:hypothetical protein EDB84DRAFT_1115251 [Lactarius hengduanensis]|nr:hypothetical protein EDB84DRAFT_1115251 [Lactarius hengduanensis]